MDARTAHGWGLVNRLTAPGTALEGALSLAERIVKNGPRAVDMTKRIISESPAWPAADIWTLQAPLVESVLATNDAREGVLAFAEKREPRWSGT